jgi:hypothetical protein
MLCLPTLPRICCAFFFLSLSWRLQSSHPKGSEENTLKISKQKSVTVSNMKIWKEKLLQNSVMSKWWKPLQNAPGVPTTQEQKENSRNGGSRGPSMEKTSMRTQASLNAAKKCANRTQGMWSSETVMLLLKSSESHCTRAEDRVQTTKNKHMSIFSWKSSIFWEFCYRF